jgi:hypothetical protein
MLIILYGCLFIIGLYSYMNTIKKLINFIPFKILCKSKYFFPLAFTISYFIAYCYISSLVKFNFTYPMVNFLLFTGMNSVAMSIYGFMIQYITRVSIVYEFFDEFNGTQEKKENVIKNVNVVDVGVNECLMCYNTTTLCKLVKEENSICNCDPKICKDCLFVAVSNKEYYQCPYCKVDLDIKRYFDSEEYCKSINLNLDDFNIHRVDDNNYMFVKKYNLTEYKVHLHNNRIISKYVVTDLMFNDIKFYLELFSNFSLIKDGDKYFIRYDNKKCKIHFLAKSENMLMIKFDSWDGIITVFFLHIPYNIELCSRELPDKTIILPMTSIIEQNLSTIPEIGMDIFPFYNANI